MYFHFAAKANKDLSHSLSPPIAAGALSLLLSLLVLSLLLSLLVLSLSLSPPIAAGVLSLSLPLSLFLSLSFSLYCARGATLLRVAPSLSLSRALRILSLRFLAASIAHAAVPIHLSLSPGAPLPLYVVSGYPRIAPLLDRPHSLSPAIVCRCAARLLTLLSPALLSLMRGVWCARLSSSSISRAPLPRSPASCLGDATRVARPPRALSRRPPPPARGCPLSLSMASTRPLGPEHCACVSVRMRLSGASALASSVKTTHYRNF